jgi:hypothetical protein
MCCNGGLANQPFACNMQEPLCYTTSSITSDWMTIHSNIIPSTGNYPKNLSDNCSDMACSSAVFGGNVQNCTTTKK